MTPAAWIAIVGIVATCLLTVIINIVMSAFFAGKVVAKMETMSGQIAELKESSKAAGGQFYPKNDAIARFDKYDEKLSAIWTKMDKMKKICIKLLQKSGFEISEEDI